jgi:prepilin-type N-terminal cleavage/methylation domain-containing protein
VDGVRSDRGFGLVELLIAMTVLAVGLMALVAAFSSATFGVKRAGVTASAATLADNQMESFRMMIYDQVGVDTASGTLTALDATYKNDTACYDTATATNCTQSGSPAAKKLVAPSGLTCATVNTWYPFTTPCTPSRTTTGPDLKSYRIDTYVSSPAAVSTAQRKRKQVTIVVRDGTTNTVLARETSTIDCSTAGPTVSACP